MKKKLLSIILAAVMLLSLMPTAAFAQYGVFSDTSGHWAEAAIETWTGHGVLSGYPGGEFKPNSPITRAELAAVLNRVMGYTATTDTAFTDVPAGEWYASDIAKLFAAGIMAGDGNDVMRPTANITREEAAVMIARAFAVPENAENINPFPDAAEISGWASFLVEGMKAAGYISGDQNGNFNPKAPITRAEVVTILNNMIDGFYNTSGEYNLAGSASAARNIAIRTAGVTLKNGRTNNLYITEGVADGDVTLEDVVVTGTAFIRGGGANSINIISGVYYDIILNGKTNTRLAISGDAKISRIFVMDTGTITHKGLTASYSAGTNTATYTCDDTIERIEIHADNSAAVIIDGIAYVIIPPEGAASKITVNGNAIVKEIVTNDSVSIDGSGIINKMTVHNSGVVIDKSVNVRPQDIAVDNGVKINVADKNYTGEGKPLPPNETPNNNSTGGGTSIGGNGSTVNRTVTGITVSPSAVNATIGTAIVNRQLTASVSVTGGASQAVTWSVYNAGTTGAGKVTITADGKLNIAADATTGTAIIRATSVYDTSKYGTCTVTVSPTPTTYSLMPLHITGQSTTHGSVSIDLGNPSGNAQGASVTIKAAPEPGYIFVGWVKTDDRTAPIEIGEAEHNFNITANTTLYAIFTGDGDIHPTEIATEAEFDAVRNGLDKDYKLLNDITLTSAWTPIGDWSTRFTGTFDGGGRTITLGADVAVADDFAGLFGVIGVSGKVRNLTVAGNISVSGVDVIIGGIAGYNLGTIEKCAMLGDVIVTDGDRSNVGGIAGWSGTGSTITNCYSLGAINANGSEYNYVGGIAGRGQGGAIITNCYSLGNITASGGSTRNSVGGIAGELTLGAIASYCYAMGAVSSSGSTNESAGGITGRSDGGRIENCVALNASITGTTNAGRIWGYSVGASGINNRAIPIGTLPDGAHNDTNGATIGTGDVLAADYWKNTTNGIWKDVFAAYPSDTHPWVAVDGQLPHLYWQTTAPTLPTHFPTGASAASPLAISTSAGLAAIANSLDKHYKLIDDINVGANWTPIGSTGATAFTGSLNGNGKTVTIGGIKSGLAADTVGSSGDYTYAGLFGYIGAGGVVECLAVAGTVEYTGTDDSINVFIGGIAGDNRGTIKNCYTTASVSGTALGSRAVYAGGIVGYNVGMIENCYASGNVSGSGDFQSIGGIAGLSDHDGTVQNCVALNSELSGTGGTAFIGRIVGVNNGAGLTNNHGRTDMTRYPSGSWNYKTATGIDGADASSANSTLESWWKTTSGLGWDWGSIWNVEDDGDYPHLR